MVQWAADMVLSCRIREHITGVLRGHEQEVCGLKWSPSGTQLASGGNDNLLHVWSATGAHMALSQYTSHHVSEETQVRGFASGYLRFAASGALLAIMAVGCSARWRKASSCLRMRSHFTASACWCLVFEATQQRWHCEIHPAAQSLGLTAALNRNMHGISRRLSH